MTRTATQNSVFIGSMELQGYLIDDNEYAIAHSSIYDLGIFDKSQLSYEDINDILEYPIIPETVLCGDFFVDVILFEDLVKVIQIMAIKIRDYNALKLLDNLMALSLHQIFCDGFDRTISGKKKMPFNRT
jgi:hypothetical protein